MVLISPGQRLLLRRAASIFYNCLKLFTSDKNPRTRPLSGPETPGSVPDTHRATACQLSATFPQVFPLWDAFLFFLRRTAQGGKKWTEVSVTFLHSGVPP